MPPSGFSQKAINGLLEFVKANYQNLAEKYSQANFSEQKFLEKISNEIEKQIQEALVKIFQNQELLNKGIKGLMTFVIECFRDLSKEIEAGQDKYQRPVVDGKAIQKEINQIKEYLEKFEI